MWRLKNVGNLVKVVLGCRNTLAVCLPYRGAGCGITCRDDLELQPQGRCDIREEFGAPTVEEMAVVVNAHRPVIFRGGAKALKLDRTLWSLQNMLTKYGE